MREDLSCLRCGEKMQLIRREFIQLGKDGVFSGDWGNRLEFFRADWNQEPEEEAGSIAKVSCPYCGHSCDMDAPKCPYCGAKNTRL